ncbi:uncharacterized protein LOC122071343 [Macadamia integrifolia]|uniref:uncharacterized protein LOC122071343 n=1 Tax=Macadamia integrifolia TaxID=60698 RepID=UPI001C4FE195|nr:uncharacterized protein LOC122071343 [Macadamia integrifolia]
MDGTFQRIEVGKNAWVAKDHSGFDYLRLTEDVKDQNGEDEGKDPRFRIPCLNPPPVVFDFDEDLLFNNNQYDNGRKSLLLNGKEEEEEDFDDCDSGDDGWTSSAVVSCREELLEEDDDEGGEIDVRAEEFIAKFYQQMKLQLQISYIQYYDMLNRGTS